MNAGQSGFPRQIPDKALPFRQDISVHRLQTLSSRLSPYLLRHTFRYLSNQKVEIQAVRVDVPARKLTFLPKSFFYS